MASVTSKPKTFKGTVAQSGPGRAHLPIPFDPATIWGTRDVYHVAGVINGMKIRGPLKSGPDGYAMPLGTAWLRDNPLRVGQAVAATLAIEGPQRDALAPDVAKALKAEPAAARFWDAIAQFYRKGYLSWIDSTKKSPEERVRRIAEVVRLLKAGKKVR